MDKCVKTLFILCERLVDNHPERYFSTKRRILESYFIHILEILDLSGDGGHACEQVKGYQGNIQRVFHKLSPFC